jgi:Na+/H+ antiporter
VEILAIVVAMVAAVFVVAALARRFGLLMPVLMTLVGLLASLLPGLPEIHLTPEVVLVGILPPLLYVAALHTSVPAFRFNLRPILLLAVGLVLFSTVAVGVVLHALLPTVPWSICFALGAVVAPPDAVAATAVARRVGLPRRVVRILEGESLLNDASALVLLRVCVAAAVSGVFTVRSVALEATVATGGGVLVGVLGAVVFGWAHRRISDPLLDNTLSLLTPFVVVLTAELVHASGIVAVVVTGLYLGHRLPMLMSAGSRLQMGAFWRMMVFVLEGLVFLLVGLQLRQVFADLRTPPAQTAVITAAVLATVIVARFVWVFPATYVPRWFPRVRARDPAPPWQVPAVIGWAGMRGVVTLAAALALPLTLHDGRPYPRDLFLWLAFAVIVGTLVIQGATLPAVARRLRLRPDDPAVDALAEAAIQHQASQAALARLDELADGVQPDVLERLHRLADGRSNSAWERLGTDGRETPSQAYVRLRREMLAAEREVFRRARDEGTLDEDVLKGVQHELDLEESSLERGADG